MSAEAGRPRRLLWLLAGFGVWSSALVALYALHAIGCAYGWAAGPLRSALVATLALHLAALAGAFLAARRVFRPGSGRMIGELTTLTLWAALAATLLALAPPLALSLCL